MAVSTVIFWYPIYLDIKSAIVVFPEQGSPTVNIIVRPFIGYESFGHSKPIL